MRHHKLMLEIKSSYLYVPVLTGVVALTWMWWSTVGRLLPLPLPWSLRKMHLQIFFFSLVSSLLQRFSSIALLFRPGCPSRALLWYSCGMVIGMQRRRLAGSRSPFFFRQRWSPPPSFALLLQLSTEMCYFCFVLFCFCNETDCSFTPQRFLLSLQSDCVMPYQCGENYTFLNLGIAIWNPNSVLPQQANYVNAIFCFVLFHHLGERQIRKHHTLLFHCSRVRFSCLIKPGFLICLTLDLNTHNLLYMIETKFLDHQPVL